MTDELSETPFRVYRLDEVDAPPTEPAFLGASDDVSLADLLLDLHKRGRIDDRTRVGILYRPYENATGSWIVNPWAHH